MKDSNQAAPTARKTRGRKQATHEMADERLTALAAERLAIEGVSIEIDGGRFPAKAVAGWPTRIEADIFSDGHEVIDAAFVFRKAGAADETEVPMRFLVNDRWTATATFPENAFYECSFLGWRDLYAAWRRDTAKKVAAGVDIGLELEEGRRLIDAALGGDGRDVARRTRRR